MTFVRDVVPGVTINEIFYHVNSSLTTSSFTINLFRDGVLDNSIGVSITEVETNYYKVQFTIDSGEDVLWEMDVFETANPTDGRYRASWRARQGVPVNVVQANGEAYTGDSDAAYIKSMVENIYSSLQAILGKLN